MIPKKVVQAIHPKVEIYTNKKRKHTLSVLRKNLKKSISRKGKRGQ